MSKQICQYIETVLKALISELTKQPGGTHFYVMPRYKLRDFWIRHAFHNQRFDWLWKISFPFTN